MKGRRRPTGLSVPQRATDSFDVHNGQFRAGDIVIDETGTTLLNQDQDTRIGVFPARDAHKPRLIGDFNEIELLDEILGRGASCYVQKAIHKPSQTFLALKVISIYERDKRHQLLKEIRTLYHADCPNLITFHGAFYDDGHISIALELMENGSLADVQAIVGRIDETPLAFIARSILNGLCYLHDHKRVHRDVKPSNCCLAANGHVKLNDFGISAELQSTIAMCETFVGTATYMSPERIEGRAYSAAADIWSFGILCLEVATGRFPYPETKIYIDLVQKIVHDPPPTLPADEFSAAFCDFVSLAVRKDLHQRATAQELLNHEWIQTATAQKFDQRRWMKSVRKLKRKQIREKRAAQQQQQQKHQRTKSSCSPKPTRLATPTRPATP